MGEIHPPLLSPSHSAHFHTAPAVGHNPEHQNSETKQQEKKETKTNDQSSITYNESRSYQHSVYVNFSLIERMIPLSHVERYIYFVGGFEMPSQAKLENP